MADRDVGFPGILTRDCYWGCPLSALAPLLWRAVLREPGVTKSSFTTAWVAGFVFHGLVLLNLLVDKSGWVAW